MDKATLVNQWVKAPLLTPKHDPTGLAVVWEDYRTVLASDVAQNLTGYLLSCEFILHLYHDRNPRHASNYYVIESTGGKFNVPASGVPSGSLYPIGDCDRLVIVSGRKQGWHIFGDESAVILARQNSGVLIYSGEIT